MADRATSLSPPEFGLLCDWGHRVKEAYGAMPYLVGSAARAAKDWRDVDVRVLLDEDEWEALGCPSGLRLRALNLGLSFWGQKATGLPIDAQFQRRYDANEEFGQEVRHPIGIKPPARWPEQEVQHG